MKPAASDSVAIELHDVTSVSTLTTLVHPQNDSSMIRASVRMNTLLLVGKSIAAVMSSSPAILASLVDSTVDVLIQAALFWASQAAQHGAKTALYPVGRGQLEPVAVVVCAALKCAGMVAVCARSIDLLLDADRDFNKHGCISSHDVHKHGLRHIIHDHWDSVALLALVSVVKFAFCYWCEMKVRGQSGRGQATETARAVVADNRNDVVLSVGALIATVVTQLSAPLWFVDPSAACALAIFIFLYWVSCGRKQVDLIIGRAAPDQMIEMIRELAETHDPSMSLDTVRAYHFGPRFLVELEVVMEEATPLRESHDCGILLQHKIEALSMCERCFVRIDYQHRPMVDVHDHTTPVVRKMHSSVQFSSPMDDVDDEMLPSCHSRDALLGDIPP